MATLLTNKCLCLGKNDNTWSKDNVYLWDEEWIYEREKQTLP